MRPVVAASFGPNLDVLQYLKTLLVCVVLWALNHRSARDGLGNRQTFSKALKFRRREALYRAEEVLELFEETACSILQPISVHVGSMNAKRSSDRIPNLLSSQLVLAGKTSIPSTCLMNKRVVESLIKAGALDSLGKRGPLYAAVDKAMERAQKAQRDEAHGQMGLFGLFNESPAHGHAGDELPKAPDWEEGERLANEKEVLGFFVSGHPMDRFAEKLRNLPNVLDTAAALERGAATGSTRLWQPGDDQIAVAGLITSLKLAKSKRSGERYAQAALEDAGGSIDLICFPKDYERLANDLKLEVPVVVRGSLRTEEGLASKLAISSIQILEEIVEHLPENIRIRVPMEHLNEAILTELRDLIVSAPGAGRLMLCLEQPGEYTVLLEPAELTVRADHGLLERITLLLGGGTVEVIDSLQSQS